MSPTALFKRAMQRIVPLSLALAFVLAACAPAGAADSAGIIRVAFQPLVQTDPALISSDTEVFVANAVYDYLVDIDPDSNPVARLATDWQVSDDGLTYVFTLAEGVTFHDGSELTAEDVVWTFDRLRDPENGFATADTYGGIASIEATGDLEVTFSLSEPNPFFLYDLSDNHALVMSSDTLDPTDFNGTGPFVVDSYSPEDRIVLTANENYFVDGQPRLGGAEVIFFSDENAMVDALRGGQVDLVMRMSTPLFASLQDVDGIQTYDIPTNGFDLIRLRADREPGNNPLVIQAMKLATDREAILELIQQGYGAIGNDSPIGPLFDAYHDSGVTPPARDVDAARDLLAEAGYADGLNLVLHVPNSGGRPDLAAVLQDQWSDAGINIEISVEPEEVYYGEDGWLEVDLGITGWGSRPYPQFYLDTMLVTDSIWNESHFSDEEFDRLAALAGSTLDEDERIEAYSQIQQLLVERGPVIIPYYFPQFAAIRDGFTGFQVEAFAGRTDLHTISLTE